jgi:hypothetical protein
MQYHTAPQLRHGPVSPSVNDQGNIEASARDMQAVGFVVGLSARGSWAPAGDYLGQPALNDQVDEYKHSMQSLLASQQVQPRGSYWLPGLPAFGPHRRCRGLGALRASSPHPHSTHPLTQPTNDCACLVWPIGSRWWEGGFQYADLQAEPPGMPCRVRQLLCTLTRGCTEAGRRFGVWWCRAKRSCVGWC